MPLESSKPGRSSVEGDKHGVLDKEIKDMVSAITRRVCGVHEPGSSQGRDDDGVRIITLAGSNSGATMRSELDEKSSSPHGISLGEHDTLSTYVNSNFQAVNNSIMLGSSYNTNDPGVHLDISDVAEQEGKKSADKDRRGKKIGKDSTKTEHSD
ncbi:putative Auxin-induced protein 5NG4 [Hibiscus syriacus]|uniref:Auxin-induced protein 5NG4 n=1 Tax=Hibiscus syriacus TaxID=106335 RepID=A0A6A3CFH6_HIBSY|nr:putative Auxin-induced protein 5NG4 [Hibiscus syriacus]